MNEQKRSLAVFAVIREQGWSECFPRTSRKLMVLILMNAEPHLAISIHGRCGWNNNNNSKAPGIRNCKACLLKIMIIRWWRQFGNIVVLFLQKINLCHCVYHRFGKSLCFAKSSSLYLWLHVTLGRNVNFHHQEWAGVDPVGCYIGCPGTTLWVR